MILGEAGVGKTSLLASTPKVGIPEDIPVLKEMQEAYTDLMFEFGCDHEMLPAYDWPVMYQYSNSDEKDCRLLLYPVCRESIAKHRSQLAHEVCWGASAAFLVFDSTRFETFKKLDEWRKILESVPGKVPMVIVENKVDLEGHGQRDIFEGYAESHDALYIRTSAKRGDNPLLRGFEEMYKRVCEN